MMTSLDDFGILLKVDRTMIPLKKTSESLRKNDRLMTPLDDFGIFVEEALRLPVGFLRRRRCPNDDSVGRLRNLFGG